MLINFAHTRKLRSTKTCLHAHTYMYASRDGDERASGGGVLQYAVICVMFVSCKFKCVTLCECANGFKSISTNRERWRDVIHCIYLRICAALRQANTKWCEQYSYLYLYAESITLNRSVRMTFTPSRKCLGFFSHWLYNLCMCLRWFCRSVINQNISNTHDLNTQKDKYKVKLWSWRILYYA